jgi:hypothetical protein
MMIVLRSVLTSARLRAAALSSLMLVAMVLAGGAGTKWT